MIFLEAQNYLKKNGRQTGFCFFFTRINIEAEVQFRKPVEKWQNRINEFEPQNFPFGVVL